MSLWGHYCLAEMYHTLFHQVEIISLSAVLRALREVLPHFTLWCVRFIFWHMLVAKSESRERNLVTSGGHLQLVGCTLKVYGVGAPSPTEQTDFFFFLCLVCQNHLRTRVSTGCWHVFNTSLICFNFPLNRRNCRDRRCSGGWLPGSGTRVGGCHWFMAVEFQFGRAGEVLEMVAGDGCSGWRGPLS